MFSIITIVIIATIAIIINIYIYIYMYIYIYIYIYISSMPGEPHRCLVAASYPRGKMHIQMRLNKDL